jgi:hypothetical protein
MEREVDMPKLLPFFMLLILVSGCNLPINPTPIAPEEVQTRVAATLTALTSPEGASTSKGDPTSTQTLSPDSTLTSAPIPTTTPTPEVSATQENWKFQLGSPAFNDPLTNGDGWYLSDDDQTTVSATGSALVLTSLNAIGWHGWSLNYHKMTDFYLEATIKTGICSGSDQYGLVFRSPDFQKGYFFTVTCSGNYVLRSFDGSQFSLVTAVNSSDAILSGSNQVNRLGVKAVGNKIELYANDKLLETIQDNSFDQSGAFGVFIAGYETPNFSIALDDISYWLID